MFTTKTLRALCKQHPTKFEVEFNNSMLAARFEPSQPKPKWVEGDNLLGDKLMLLEQSINLEEFLIIVTIREESNQKKS